MGEQTNALAPLRSLSAAEARARLAEEMAAGTGAGEGRKAKMLPLTAIETVESLFQPREIAEHHVTGMVKDLKTGDSLPPLLVYWTGKRAVLLDGHHRREAYLLAKKPEGVPVEWFSGSLDAAIAEAGAHNCQDKLAMSTPQRMNFAWRLVKLGTLSKAEMRKAAAVGDGEIAVMRRVLGTLQPMIRVG